MRFRGLILDLDGVFHVGDRLLPGAVEALEFLRARQIPFRIVTNTTTRSRESLVARMRQIGLSLEIEDVITAPRAAVLHLRGLDKPRCRFLLTDDARGEFAEFENHDNDPTHIIIGDIEDQVNYVLLNSVFNQMINGSELVALHKGRFWEAENGLNVDLGLFVTGLEYTTGKTATVIGKPSEKVFELALQDLSLKNSECAMIGDDIFNDVGGAQAAGLAGILIRTGKFRPEQLKGHAIIPDKVFESLGEIQSLFAS